MTSAQIAMSDTTMTSAGVSAYGCSTAYAARNTASCLATVSAAKAPLTMPMTVMPIRIVDRK